MGRRVTLTGLARLDAVQALGAVPDRGGRSGCSVVVVADGNVHGLHAGGQRECGTCLRIDAVSVYEPRPEGRSARNWHFSCS